MKEEEREANIETSIGHEILELAGLLEALYELGQRLLIAWNTAIFEKMRHNHANVAAGKIPSLFRLVYKERAILIAARSLVCDSIGNGDGNYFPNNRLCHSEGNEPRKSSEFF